MDVTINTVEDRVDQVVSDVPGLDAKAVRRIVEAVLAELRAAGGIDQRRRQERRITLDLDTLDQPAELIARKLAAALLSRLG